MPGQQLIAGRAGAATTTPRRHRATTLTKNRNRAVPWLLAPAAIVMAVLTAAPLVLLFLFAVTDYNQATLFTGHFDVVGLRQFTRIFTDPGFLGSLLRTVAFTAAMVVGTVSISMAVAQLMTRVHRPIRLAITVVLIFAWAIPSVASALLWVWMFQPTFGVVGWVLTRLRIFGDVAQVNWLQTPGLAFAAVWLLVIWHSIPFITLTLYAAQTQLPQEYIEAARLDGAGEWRLYWNVAVPFLRPTLQLLLILSVIWDFNIFNDIWLTTKGGPGNSTSTLAIWGFQKAFVGLDFGQGAAIGVVTLVLLLIFTGYYVRNLLHTGEEI